MLSSVISCLVFLKMHISLGSGLCCVKSRNCDRAGSDVCIYLFPRSLPALWLILQLISDAKGSCVSVTFVRSIERLSSWWSFIGRMGFALPKTKAESGRNADVASHQVAQNRQDISSRRPHPSLGLNSRKPSKKREEEPMRISSSITVCLSFLIVHCLPQLSCLR